MPRRTKRKNTPAGNEKRKWVFMSPNGSPFMSVRDSQQLLKIMKLNTPDIISPSDVRYRRLARGLGAQSLLRARNRRAKYVPAEKSPNTPVKRTCLSSARGLECLAN